MNRHLERAFFARVTEAGTESCWRWNGARNESGYGLFISRTYQLRVRAHRFSYEFLRAQIPPGLVLDHLCRVRLCVNPWHVEPVTDGVNVKRGAGTAGRLYIPATPTPYVSHPRPLTVDATPEMRAGHAAFVRHKKSGEPVSDADMALEMAYRKAKWKRRSAVLMSRKEER